MPAAQATPDRTAAASNAWPRQRSSGYGAIVVDITDDELAAEAMAADPDIAVPDDAVPFGDPVSTGLLPDWYMPVRGQVRRTRPRVMVVAGLILSLLVVNGAGLCVTYGWPEIAW